MSEPLAQAVPETTASLRPRHLRHIRELDGLRGIAAVAVFFHHVCFTSVAAKGWSAPILWLRDVSIWGMYGVDLFFVLSGFLITSLLLEARGAGSYYHDFYWKRVLRILPLYILCLLVVALFIPGSRGYVIMSALFVANFAWLLHIGSVGPFWTLAIEEQFYLLWPTVVRRRSVAQLRRWSLSIAGSAILLRLIAAAFGHRDYLFTFFRCDALAGGAFLACWLYRRDAEDRTTSSEDRILAGTLLLGGLLFAASQLPAQGPRAVAYASASLQTSVTLVATAIVAFLITRSGSRGLALFRSPLLTFFGLISYAFYMTHTYVMDLYDHLRGPLIAGDTEAYWIRFAAILMSTVALCLFTRYVIELPAMSLRRFVLVKPAPPNPHPTLEDPPLPLGNM